MTRGPQGGHPGKVPIDRLAPGGVLLGQPQPQQPQMQLPPRTLHVINLNGCTIGIFPVLDDEGKCDHYKLLIQDVWENKHYHFDFQDDVREHLETQISELPLVGNKLQTEEVEDASETRGPDVSA